MDHEGFWNQTFGYLSHSIIISTCPRKYNATTNLHTMCLGVASNITMCPLCFIFQAQAKNQKVSKNYNFTQTMF